MKGWSALLSALGLVAILFALLSLLLGLAGAPTDLSWIGGNFALGVVLLGAGLFSSLDTLRERMHTGESRRIGKYGTSAVASTALALVILGLAAFLSERYHHRFDWTETGVHSLSDQTKKVLAGLDQDVTVVGFYGPMAQRPVQDLLDRYSYESPRFQVEFADPTARPDLVESLGVSQEKLGEGLVRIALGSESVELTEVDEERVTNALVKLTRTAQKRVYFLEGHAERPASGEGADAAQGFAQAADALRNENYLIETLLLEQKGEVPEDADVLVVAGPRRPLRPVEHDALRRYLERGGALLVLIDPRAETDLAGDLRGYGVDLGDDVVVDRMQGLFGRAATPFARSYADHEITRGLREVTLFHVARSVQPAADADSRFTEIVKTGDDSWGERDLDLFFQQGRAERSDDDFEGPVPIAVAGTPLVAKPAAAAPAEGETAPATKPEDEPRLVVFGDSDFASNELIGAYRNRDLFVNSVNWLLGDVEAISIRPSTARASRIELTTEQLSTIRYLSLFVLPEAIAALGVWAWWSRRRAPGR
jgi:ABC-type uncharacterized transport system involved in gliding motility auxiliary subunit